jgi:glucose/arabinose dehydrogenase
MRRHLPILALAALAVLALALACDGGNGSSSTPKPQATTEVPVPSPFAGITSEVVVPTADVPVALAFAPDGRLFYAEQNTGAVRIVSAQGELQAAPFVQAQIAPGPGWGLLGLALDPDFESNHYVYLYLTRPTGGEAQPVVVRYTEANNKGTNPTTIVDDLPEATLYGEYAVAGDLRFGPDGYLYITVGDHISTELAQDLSSVRGKVLRVDKSDGSAAPDNPFAGQADADPRVYAYGFLDPHDLTFEPASGALFATENGTYFCCDELNAVREGGDYGWPKIGQDQKGVLPVYFFNFPGTDPFSSKVRPEGVEFVTAAAYPALGDSLLVCEEATRYMRRLVLNANQTKTTSDDVVVADCSLDIATSPDGTIYYSNATEIRKLVAGAGQ